LHAILLAGTVPLFLGALLADLAYWSSAQIQWSNFASWLIVGGLVYGAAALVCAVLSLLRASHRGGRAAGYTVLLALAWATGLWDALVHARDAWAVMPAGVVLSLLATALACAATAIGLAGLRAGVAR